MLPTRAWMLERMGSRDSSANGRFLTGVVTTGIYCLPSCPARKPLARNVRFFATEEEAMAAGLRPCKRCRPDHFYRSYDGDGERVAGLVAAVRAQPAAFSEVSHLRAAAGVGLTALNRLLRTHLHSSPADLLHRTRVAAAGRLLLATRRSVLDIGAEAGYPTPSVFNDQFRRLTGLTPTRFRELGRGRPEMVIDLPPGHRVADALAHHGRDPESPTERWLGGRLARAVWLDGQPAVIVLAPSARAVAVSVHGAGRLSPASVVEAHAVARRMLGLDLDPTDFERRARREPALAAIVRRRTGLRIPLTPTVFEGLAWAIVGQQVNLAFAARLRRVLIAAAGTPAAVPGFTGLVCHPTVAQVAKLEYRDLTRHQYSQRKAEYLVDAARDWTSGDLESLRDGLATRAERALLAVRGLGPWSVNYALMRACGFADCVPVGDSGLVAALRTVHGLAERPGPDATRALMAPFAPYRSLATFHLWSSLGD